MNVTTTNISIRLMGTAMMIVRDFSPSRTTLLNTKVSGRITKITEHNTFPFVV